MRSFLCILFAAGIAVAQQPKAKTGPAFEEEIYGKLPPRKDKSGKTVKGPRP